MIENIDITKLSPHPNNPRKNLFSDDLSELVESIKVKGILQNLTVVPDHNWYNSDTKEFEKFIVVIGHRRLAAAKLAGLTEVPCAIADMTPQEQIATMLIENIQRTDLTVYEQAQGIQMMLDLGETVNNIAEKTGFSETTVRRRVKLLELDQKKLKASAERGATLIDFAELDKIKDIKLRNSVLEKIGTHNFQWELQRAIEKEKQDKNKALIKAELERFATKIDSNDGSFSYVDSFSASWDPKITVPEDVDTEEYFYTISGSYFSLYKKKSQTKVSTPWDEKQKETQERRTTLEELSNQAYKLRRDFVRGVSNTTAKKKIDVIIEYSLRVTLLEYCYGVDYDDFTEYLGIEIEDDDDEWNFDDIAERIMAQPERHLLVATYLSLDSGRDHYHNWDGSHYDNEMFNTVYTFLEKLGYEMSDEERALKDGTHRLFQNSK
jgi:ParB family chromosome partitioning protein